MQFSSNGSTGKMNISVEADRAFLDEVRRRDPARYSRLERAIFNGSYLVDSKGPKKGKTLPEAISRVNPVSLGFGPNRPSEAL